MNAPGPVFITGRFRCGSTLLWNLFRHVEGCTAYYEPFHESLWAPRPPAVDPTHRRVSDYWAEYLGVRDLAGRYRRAWAFDDLLMDADSRNPGMKDYVSALIDRAPGRAVIKFNRIDFRLPWFRRHFPRAKIVHLHRHPRDQWFSMLRDKRLRSKDARLSSFQAAGDPYYLLAWARDLKRHFPFLDERGIRPYRLFYCLWRLSHAYGAAHADYSLAFERLVDDPRAQCRSLMEAVGVERYDLERLTRLIVAPERGKWRRYADEDWFRRQEAACEEALGDFFAARPRAAAG